jgi:hypothetical protein
MTRVDPLALLAPLALLGSRRPNIQRRPTKSANSRSPNPYYLFKECQGDQGCQGVFCPCLPGRDGGRWVGPLGLPKLEVVT